MRTLLKTLVLPMTAALALAVAPRHVQAQKALVYCPVSVDASGCTVIKAALTASYPGGVETGFDGTAGTVDLKTVDLFQYSVFVVPSLAETDSTAPYALLRDAAVATRLKQALIGRRAFWSGTPDQGVLASTRPLKDALIQNLASWASASFATVNAPGLVVLQDNSDDVARRYSWVQPITGLNIIADPKLASYSSVQSLSGAGNAVLTSNGSTLAYANMASYGFQTPTGAAGLSMDAVGKTGTTVGGQVVLITQSGGNTGGASVQTDKDDYAPGTPVVITGTGFGANETVTLLFHEDPTIEPDFTRTTTTDASGSFTYSGFEPDTLDVDVRFILTATGQTSAKTAQTTFTDANSGDGSGTMTVAPASVTPGSTTSFDFTYVAGNGSNTLGASSIVTLDIASGWTAPATSGTAGKITTSTTGLSPACTLGSVTVAASRVTVPAQCAAGASFKITYASATAPSPAAQTSYPFTASSRDGSGGTLTSLKAGSPSITVDAVVVTRSTTTSIARTSGNNPSVYGEAVSFTATVTAAGGNPSGVGTVTFKDGTTTICSAVALSGNTATCSPTASQLGVGTHNYTAQYSGVATGALQFSTSTSSALAHSVSAQPLTVAGITATNKVYDGNVTATLVTSAASLVGVIGSDAVTLDKSAAAGAFNDKDVASAKTVTVSGLKLGGPAAGNYTLTQPTTTADITKKALAASFTASSKTYDATTAAVIATRALTGVVAPDVVTLTGGTAVFGSATVGTGKTVTAAASSFALGGADAANYSIGSVASTTADVTAAALTLSFTVNSKVYDGNTSATITSSSITAGLVPNDKVNLTNGSATFADKLAGTGKTVTATGFSLGGQDKDNYTVPASVTTTGDITQKSLTVTITATSKQYDGTTTAVVTPTLGAGVVGSDAVTVAATAADFASKTVGTGKTVTATLALGGADAANYKLASTTATALANITAKALTGTIAAQDKVYDGTTSATVTGSLGAGVVGTDAVTLGVTGAAFGTKVVGAGKTVSANLALSGADAANYTVNPTATTTASITAKPLTATATAQSKVYDGTTAATASAAFGAPSGVVSGDAAVLSAGSASFADKNVGTAKTVSVPVTLTGADAANYSIASGTLTATADITSRPIAVSADALTKTYGQVDPPLTYTVGSGSLAVGDAFSGTLARAAGDNVGTYAIQQGTLTAGTNYTLSFTGANLTITKGTQTITFAKPADPTYGASQIPLTGSASSGLPVTIAGTGACAVSSGGGANMLSTSGAGTCTVTASQPGDGNFNAAPDVTYTLSVNKAAITVASLTASSKEYDGTAAATITASQLSGVVGTDAVSLSIGSATFDTKAVGSGKTVTASALGLGGAQAGNYALSSATASTTANITAKPATATITASNKEYDGTAAATAVGIAAGTIAGDNVGVAVTGAAFADKAVGPNKTVTATVGFTGSDAGNYSLAVATASATASITAKALTVGSIVVNSKVYDGTTAATIASSTLGGGVIGNDQVSLAGGSAAFGDKNVGTGKPITLSGFTLSGADAGNYSLGASLPSVSADITKRPITGSTIAAGNKIYDGTTDAVIVATIGTGAINGDNLTLLATGSFADRNVGAGKTVTASLSLGGGDANNYTLGSSTSATATADITAKALSGSFTASNKQYDGSAAATVASSSLPGVIAPDVVTLTVGSPAFPDKSVGTGRTVTAALSLAGTGAGNYTVNATSTATADITPASVSGAFTVSNKVYDATTAATIATRTIGSGIIGSDAVSLTGGSAAFNDKNVGTGKTVTGTGFTLGGGDAGNYVLTPVSTTTADITAAPVSPSITASDKLYDATTSATIATRSVVGTLGSDAVALTGGSATFADKNVGTGKTVTATGLSITGADAANYALGMTSATTTASITPASLAASFTAADKVYDGTDAATITARSVSGTLASDNVTLTGGTATFASKTVGASKTVTGTGFSLGGTDGGNYVIAAGPATTTASITAKPVSASITAQSKTYDGNVTAEVTSLLTGAIAGDAVSPSASNAKFDSKNVGAAKTVTADIALSGGDASNYALGAPTASTTAAITAKALAGSITAANKVYDGTRNASASGALADGVVSGDGVALDVSNALFDTRDVGTGKSVSANLTLSGSDALNSSVNATATATANITPKPISATATAESKVYDGTVAAVAAATFTSPSGVVGGDAVGVEVSSATFDTKKVGTNKSVSVVVNLSGAQAGNYALAATTFTPTANITAKPLVASFTANSKVYDGTKTATVATSSLPGVLPGDAAALALASPTFDTKTVGTGKTVTAAVSLTGGDADNYSVNPTATATANITAATVTGSFTAKSKTYDATVAATIDTRSIASGVIGGDNVSLTGGAATFSDKNVGASKTVTATDFSLGGADAGNYSLAPVPTATASITPASVSPAITAASKTYDATTAATILTRTLTGTLASDELALSGGSAVFADKSVGNGKTVTATGLGLSGVDMGNYVLTATSATTTANITAASVTAMFKASNKVYDGTTAAAISDRSVSGTLLSDVVTLAGGTATFADKQAQSSKTVTAVGFTLGGADGGNYVIAAGPITTTADITQKSISGSIVAQPKVYDGTVTAVATSTLTGTVANDVVSATVGNPRFDTKNIGAAKTVTADLTLVGGDASNYNLSTPVVTTTAAITPATVTGAFTATSRVYDGTSTATIASRSINAGVVGSETVTLTGGTASFDSKTVGTGKKVTGSGFVLGGADMANYVLAPVPTTTADITARPLVVSATGGSRIYDGTTVATVGLSDDRVTNDVIASAYTSASFTDPNVGTAKVVNVAGISISGTDAGNYTANTSAVTSANITARALTVTADSKAKSFGQVDPTLTYKVTAGSLASTDAFTGGLTRAGAGTPAGENVGSYAIQDGLGIARAGSPAMTNYAYTYVPASLSIGAATTTTTAVSAPGSQQYSDLVTLSATVANTTSGSTVVPTGTVQFAIGGISVGAPVTLVNGSATLPNVALLQWAPGSRQVTAMFTSATPNFSATLSTPATLTVNQEEAAVTYSGLNYFSTGSATATTANVTLRATVTDPSDGTRGDITNAKVTFYDKSGASPVAITGCADRPVTPLVAGDKTVGTATCQWSASTGNSDAQTYTIGTVVSGYYVRNSGDDDDEVTVSKDLTSFISGGGFTVNSASSGKYAGTSGLKSNYGFNVKYNKSGTNLQGNVNLIIRSAGRLYQVKTNSISSLSSTAQAPGITGVAQFIAKANLTDVTNPLAPVALGGNMTLQMTMTDVGEPGANDKIGFTLYDASNQLLFSSNWTGGKTAEQQLSQPTGGGNVVIH